LQTEGGGSLNRGFTTYVAKKEIETIYQGLQEHWRNCIFDKSFKNIDAEIDIRRAGVRFPAGERFFSSP
jgi:hypothetical protein